MQPTNQATNQWLGFSVLRFNTLYIGQNENAVTTFNKKKFDRFIYALF